MLITGMITVTVNRSTTPYVDWVRRILIALNFVLPLPLFAQSVATPGDIVVIGQPPVAIPFPCAGAPYAAVYGPDGSFKFSKLLVESCGSSEPVGEILFDPQGIIHVAQWAGVRSYDAGLNRIFQWELFDVFDVAMNREGTLFALTLRGGLYVLRRSDPVPSLFAQLPLGPQMSTTSMDFARDGCTLLYLEDSVFSNARTMKQYDVCRNVALPEATRELPPSACSYPKVRVNADGSIFIADCQALYRVDGGGVRGYTAPGSSRRWRGLAFSPNQQALWSVAEIDNSLVELEITTGNIARGPLSSYGVAVAIFGVPRAAAQAGMAAIPAVSTEMLVVLAFAFVLIGFLRLTRP